ncbi:hypothetical protein BDY24DRAFT_443579 [Mrakia frigida]|uniref:uncharacterized protein n=1 Tax=Mrakia frigida TaxID=29902 RepID=UPI003FCC1103
MDAVRRRVSSIFRTPSDDRTPAGGGGGEGSKLSSLNRSGVGPSPIAGPSNARYDSRSSSLDRRARGSERLSEDAKFIRLGKAFRYDHQKQTWLPPTKGYVRILASASTGLRRLSVRTNSTYGQEPSRLVINCFITPTMTLRPTSDRAFTFSTAADWSFGEQTWETFAIRFSERDGGALFAEEFAREFDKAQAVNTSLLEGGAKEEEHDRLGLMKSRNGSKISLGSFGASTGQYGGGKLLKQRRSTSGSPEEGRGRWGR